MAALSVPPPQTLWDYDGDHKADPGVYHADLGAWYIIPSAGGPGLLFNWGWNEAQPVPGDYDGDKKTDPAVYVPHEGRWYIRSSQSGELVSFYLGSETSRPVPADYDGDGITDPAVYERQTGTWRIRQSSLAGAVRVESFGFQDAKPVPADYDGDGKADLAVYHPRQGNWYIFRSQEGFVLFNWGYPGARPVPGDYDGDGKTDLAVYDRKIGKWFVFRSRDGYLETQWGFSRARAVPADYDGDGKTDLAVYQREIGRWYIWQSGSGTLRQMDWGWDHATALASYTHGGIEGAVIMCFGDSITYGRGSSNDGPPTGYPDQRLLRRLGPALGGHFDIVNAGFPGETTGQGLTRIGNWLAAYQPDLTLLMEGTNDHANNRRFSNIENNLRALLSRINGAGSQSVISTIPPIAVALNPSRATQAGRTRQFNPTIYRIGASLGIPVAQTYEAIAGVPNWTYTLMHSSNHPNDAGYQQLAEEFLRTMRNAYRDGLLD